MAIAGEASVRIVPVVRGFHNDVKRKLETKRVDYNVSVGADLNQASWAKVDALRAAQEARPVTVRVQTDWSGLKRDLSQVEHIFKRNSFSRALRMNIVIAGLDLLPLLSYGAAGAAASLTTLARAAAVLPGVLGGALSSVGSLAIGLHGVKDAFSAFDQSQKEAATQARLINDGNRQLERSYRDYGNAVRDTMRDIQDLNAENRRSSLNVADALLGVQEAADRLRQGGQRTILELRRDQLSYLQAVDRLQEVNTKAQRVAEDTATANAKGVQGADKVADAIDQINKNIEKLNTDKMSKLAEGFDKASPNLQSFVLAVRSFKDEWGALQNLVQDNLFAGLDKSAVDLANRTLPMLQRGMGEVATSYNGLFKALATELGAAGNTNLMERIFGNTSVGVQNLTKGMQPFVDGILRLTKEGSDFLPRLGTAGAKVAERFDKWVNSVASDGRLDKWIDKGLDGFTMLGNTIGNLGSALSSMTDAFDGATRNQGGFLKLLETQSKKLADFLKSPRGQNTMNDYFKKTQEFIHQLKNAYKDAKPLISDVVDAAQQWSVWLFQSIGAFATFTSWIERNTKLVKPLLYLYFAQRTLKPVWEVLSGSLRAYTGLIEAASRNQALGKWSFFDWQLQKLDQLKGKATATSAAVAAAATGGGAAPGYQPGQKPSSASNIQAQAAQRGVGAYANPLFAVQQSGKIAGAGPVTSPTIPAAPMFGPMAPLVLPPDLDRPNNRLSRNQRAAKAEALALYREKASQFYDFDGQADLRGKTSAAPALGAMEGPQLPPEVFVELDRQAKLAEKSVEKVGEAAEGTAGKVDDLDKKSNSAAKSVGSTGDKSKTSAPQVEDLGKKSATAAKGTDALNSSATKAASGAGSVGTAAANAAPGVKSVGDAADAAADKIGEGRVGMVGRLAGLAGAFGPQLALMAGLAAAAAAVQKLGEQHRNAAAAAKAQDDALRNLGNTLDSVTGGVTRATIAQMGTDAGAFTDQSGLFPQVNVNDIAQRLGFNPYNTYLNAADPSKAQAFQKDIANVDTLIAQQVKSSPEYQQNKEQFDTYDLDPLTIAQALRGDRAALAKVNAARDTPIYEDDGSGNPVAIRTPDLIAMARSLPNQDAFFLGRFLNDRQSSLSAQGNVIAGATQALGRATLKPEGQIFAPYGVDPMMAIDPATGNGVVQLRQMPDAATLEEWQSKGISVRDNGPGTMATVTIDPDKAETYLQRYADGGMVRGPGGPRDDAILARVSSGEHITNASAVQHYGSGLFQALNDRKLPKFAPGGWPFPLAPMPSPDPGGGSGGNTAAPVAPPVVPPPPVTPPVNPAAPPVVTPPAASAPQSTVGMPFTEVVDASPWQHARDLVGKTVSDGNGGQKTDYNDNTKLAAPEKPSLIVLHTSEGNMSAADQANMQEQNKTSYHYIVDKDGKTVISAVPTNMAARSVYDPGNNKSINIGMAGTFTDAVGNQRAFTKEDWLARSDQLRSTAALVAREAKANGIPAKVWTGGAEGAAGIVGHNWISKNIGVTDHTDPGPNFPWQEFQAMVDQEAAKQAGMNVVSPQSPGAVFPNPLQPQPIQLSPNGNAIIPGVTPTSGAVSGYTNPAGAYSLSAALNGTKYALGGFSPESIDCSGMASAVVNSYLGLDPFSSRMATSNASEWLSAKGFVSGVGPPGSLRVGWYDRGTGVASDGHMAVTLPDGTNVESSSGIGVRFGGGAAGASDAMFDQQMWLPAGALAAGNPSLGAYIPGMPIVGLGANGMYPGGVTQEMLSGGGAASNPQNDLLKFLGGQAGSVGSNLLSIGSSFLSGITGIDFNWLTSTASTIGNAGMQIAQQGQTNAAGGAAAGDPFTQGVLSQFAPGLGGLVGGGAERYGMVNGQLQIDPEIDRRLQETMFNPALIGGGAPSDAMSEQAIRKAVQMMGPSLGIGKNPEAWVQAMVKAAASDTTGLFAVDGDPNLGTPEQKAGAALSKAVRQWGINPTTGAPDKMFAMGGTPGEGLALLSNGEYKTGAKATQHYGPALFDALNAKAIPRADANGLLRGKFAPGGWPFMPNPLAPPPGGQAAGPLPMPPPAPMPPPPPPGAAVPNISVGAQQDSVPVPSTGGAPGPGATAPAPDPGALPSVSDALAGMSNSGALSGGGGGVAQPGASAAPEGDPRATLGAAPTSQNHTNPALSGLISGIASTAGSAAAMAANLGMMGMSGGGGAALGAIPGAGAGVSAGIQAGAQMAGAVVNGAVNILSSLMVGTATNGSTASASGVPLLPQRQPMQTGVPAMQQGRVHNGDVYVTNLDEYRRTNERMDAQAAMPFIGKY